ncbi:SAM-dependent methyltransferase [Paractinoplanes durhamensis]|uniref:S-adenosyl methyltransferase n=1 Tax=Paractinoplanes durhamensis TaxID=113563 RepID=A0ABQ3Z724_9ACTN|nr:SAM-dependent methyltransferase [Actinoplanes durhamensis]GIE05623.1 hypothetical protein Adu01nite_69730 [Actinoplanes durhamensis]
MTGGQWEGDVDTSKPSTARMYDYFLGGSHHFAADRAAAEQVLGVIPNIREIARANRAFLHRAVRYMLDRGITQFLDVGSGIPTVGNVHDLVGEYRGDGRVVYVDIDPVAVTHSVNLLRDNPNAAAAHGDLLVPDAILGHDDVRELLDFRRPVGLLLVSMLHFLPDEVYPAVARLRAALAPGSYLALSHVATEAADPSTSDRVAGIYRRTSASAAVTRDRTQILEFFGDFQVTAPGLVWAGEWPAPQADAGAAPDSTLILVGAARKPD